MTWQQQNRAGFQRLCWEHGWRVWWVMRLRPVELIAGPTFVFPHGPRRRRRHAGTLTVTAVDYENGTVTVQSIGTDSNPLTPVIQRNTLRIAGSEGETS